MRNTILGKIIKDNSQINNLKQQILNKEQLLMQTQDPTQKQIIIQEITTLKQQLQEYDKKRTTLIKEIEDFTGRRLITYFSINGMIIDRDAHVIEDFLISNDLKKFDILIFSPGGLTDAAEKMIKICQTRTSTNGNFDFRIIITQHAKSAATLFALGSSKILLCECAELGPVDPQIIVYAPNGEMIRDSAHQIFYGSEQYRAGKSQADLLLLSKYDPIAIKRADTAIKHTKDIIIKRIYTNPNLRIGYSGDSDIEKELKIFTDHGALYSHGRPIYYEDIKDFQYCKNKFIQKFDDYFITDENKNNSEIAAIQKKLHELTIRSLEVVRADKEPIIDRTGNLVGFNKVALKLFETSNGLILTKEVLN